MLIKLIEVILCNLQFKLDFNCYSPELQKHTFMVFDHLRDCITEIHEIMQRSM